MMEVEDLLIKHTKNDSLLLSDAAYGVSPKLMTKLRADFQNGIPFSYLLGFSEFYGRKFYINSHVLIPRSETEQMVDILVSSQRRYQKVLDVGVGSGVILLSLLNSETARFGTGVDLSIDALNVATINARRQRLLDRCEFLQSDRLSCVRQTFDLIVSNPPYIKPISHRHLVHDKVDEFEPSMALYVCDGEYEKWFRDFFVDIKKVLEKGGTFMMEGHEMELAGQAEILRELGFINVQVLEDFGRLPRFLKAQSSQ